MAEELLIPKLAKAVEMEFGHILAVEANRKEQTMSDLIKREDAINLCEKWRNRTNEHHDKNGWYIADTLLKAIKELPSADRPQGEWIPCSERLPKPYVEVLVCDDFGWINLGAYRPCDVSEDCSGWSIHAHTKIGTEEVIAWMPLPKPWKGADDE